MKTEQQNIWWRGYAGNSCATENSFFPQNLKARHAGRLAPDRRNIKLSFQIDESCLTHDSKLTEVKHLPRNGIIGPPVLRSWPLVTDISKQGQTWDPCLVEVQTTCSTGGSGADCMKNWSRQGEGKLNASSHATCTEGTWRSAENHLYPKQMLLDCLAWYEYRNFTYVYLAFQNPFNFETLTYPHVQSILTWKNHGG